jgi:hypothetical protein
MKGVAGARLRLAKGFASLRKGLRFAPQRASQRARLRLATARLRLATGSLRSQTARLRLARGALCFARAGWGERAARGGIRGGEDPRPRAGEPDAATALDSADLPVRHAVRRDDARPDSLQGPPAHGCDGASPSGL